MAFNIKSAGLASPAWVIKFVAASTFVLQGLPNILNGYNFIDPQTSEYVNLGCDIGNMLIAAIAIFFGIPENEK